MGLTDAGIRRAKPTDKPQKISDAEGLHLLINPNGSRLWRLAYRFDGKQKLLALGKYPQVSLAEARQARDGAKKLLAGGIDPSERRKIDKIHDAAGRANTFKVVAQEYLAKMEREGRAPATVKKATGLLAMTGAIDNRPVAEISAAEVLAVLRKQEVRGFLVSARQLQSAIGAVFRYAVATARAENDPTLSLRGALTAPVVKHRAAVTDAKAFGALLRAIDGFEGQPTTLACLRLLAYLFPRPGELRMAEWSEFDLDEAIWTIPAGRMKMRKPHAIPLPTQAVAILRDLHRVTGRGKLVFPGTRSVLRPISENTINGALRRLGYSKDEATGHGFRATASTLLNESDKWRPDVIEAALAHVGADEIRRIYMRSDFGKERVTMMQWWADHIDALRDGAQIIDMPRAKA